MTNDTPQIVRFYCCESRIIDASVMEPHTADLFAIVTALSKD